MAEMARGSAEERITSVGFMMVIVMATVVIVVSIGKRRRERIEP